MRPQVTANAKKHHDAIDMQETAEKVTKASLGWQALISRIYEVDPLTCSGCSKKFKIITFVTHPEEIRRILRGMGFAIIIPEFDPPQEEVYGGICQLLADTSDGFTEPDVQVGKGPDPPADADPPHWEDHSDSPHWEE